MSSLNPTTKIGRQIGEGLRIHRGASEEEARKRAMEVLEMVEMPRPAERLTSTPSNSPAAFASASSSPWDSSARPNC